MREINSANNPLPTKFHNVQKNYQVAAFFAAKATSLRIIKHYSMKKLLQTLLLLLLTAPAVAQLSLNVFNYRPTGEFGFVMKPTVSAQLNYIKSFDEDHRFRIRAGATFLVMKPRMDVFPVFALLFDDKQYVLPGTQSFQRYDVFLLSGGTDCAIIRKKKLFVYAGLDIVLGLASVSYSDHIERLEDKSYTGGGELGGLRGRIGTEYDLNDHIGLMLEIEREGWLLSDPLSINWANRYGLGAKYNF